MSMAAIQSIISNQHLPRSVHTITSTKHPSGERVHQKMSFEKRDISYIWVKMSAMYGELFTKRNGVQDCGVWFETLNDLTRQSLDSGLLRLMKQHDLAKAFSSFPPSPMEFRKLCAGYYESMGIPSVSKAFEEVKLALYLTSKSWSHPIVGYVASKLGCDFWKNKRDAEAFSLFAKAYAQVSDKVREGDPIPSFNDLRALPKPKNTDVAKKHLDAIRHLLGV